MAKIADIRKGFTYKEGNEIWTVQDFQNVQVGRGAGFCRVTIKSLSSGKIIENKYGTSDSFEEIRVERRNYQYLYPEGDMLVFMDTNDFSQIYINTKAVDGIEFLIEGEVCEILVNTADDSPLTVELAKQVIRTVEYTEPGLAGDTATRTMKPATLEGGAEVRVPLFVNIGDKIKVDTTTRTYIERAK